MKTSDLDYYLPPELIAQHPADERSSSRLLVVDRTQRKFEDRLFRDICDYLNPGDCLVLNDTKVIPARFFAKRKTGGKIEGLFVQSPNPRLWNVMLKNARNLKAGDSIIIVDLTGDDFCQALIREKLDEGNWQIEVQSDLPAFELLEKIGIMPLPPYIRRPPLTTPSPTPMYAGCMPDVYRYQTVYAAAPGAIAAPTAGLHFTPELMQSLKNKGVTFATLTLHVGIGTFKPVTVDNLKDHIMHYEAYQLNEANATIINQAKSRCCRIIPVGTTSVRTVESIAATNEGQIIAQQGLTNLFITPGYQFRTTDAIITNFHLPKSTLLALVGAFAGLEFIISAYKHAVEQKYRFFSYGDAMMVL